MQFLKSVFLSVFILFASFGLAAAEGQRVILVLDASGSMWGQIDGNAKIDIAKDVVAKIIGSWKAEDELGLVAYGHREKGSCKDIEVLREPGPLDAGTYMKSVRALSPKGKTPMTDAVRMAADALKYTEKKATVILVSDGIETCDADPCAVAAELEKLGVNLTVHTVGFGLDNKGAVSQLKCLAEKTGGTAVLADNANELESALKQTVEAEPAPPPPPPEPAKIETNFKGKVLLAPGVNLPEEFPSASWDFAEANDGVAGGNVKTEYGATVSTLLPHAGDYMLQVTNDTVKVEVPVTIKEGAVTEQEVILDAGIISASGTTDGSQKVPDGTAYELADGEGKWLTTKYGETVKFLAKAGPAKVRLVLGSAKVEKDVTVVAGQTTQVDLSLGAGSIEASAVFSQGGDAVPAGAAIELSEGAVGVDGKHKWIDTQYGAPSLFKAPAGSYHLAATQDYAKGEADVTVKAGEMAKVTVVLNAGYLAVSAPGAANMEISGAKTISGERQWIGTEYTDKLNKAFNAGTYYVEAKAADGTVIGGKEFEVKAGGRTEGALP